MNLNWFRAIALVVLLLATLVIKSKAAWLYINIASAVVAWVSTLLLGKAHEAFIRVSIDKSLLRYLFLESKGHQKARVFFAEIVNKNSLTYSLIKLRWERKDKSTGYTFLQS